MWEVVFLTGLLVTGVSAYLFIRTEQIAGLIDRVLVSRWLYLAALFRLLLGAALIASAHTVQFSQAIALIGWLTALGGLLLVAAPQALWRGLGQWLARQSLTLMRAWLLLGLLLGAFFLYAALV